MDPNQASTMVQLLTVVVLLMLSAFFSSAETALTTVNKMRVRTLAEALNALIFALKASAAAFVLLFTK